MLWRHSGGHEVLLLLFTPSATHIVPWTGSVPGPLHGAYFGPTTLSGLCSGPSALRFLTLPGTCPLGAPIPAAVQGSMRGHLGQLCLQTSWIWAMCPILGSSRVRDLDATSGPGHLFWDPKSFPCIMVGLHLLIWPSSSFFPDSCKWDFSALAPWRCFCP